MRTSSLALFGCSSLILRLVGAAGALRSFENPILPGWNSDPSCTFVPEANDTFFCTTSSFLAFPGIPIYASKDLVHWKHVSNALSKPEQLPELSYNGGQNEGIWASTIRYRNGTFYLITSYVRFSPWGPKLILFTTTDPFNNSAWSQPIRMENPGNDIDPDLFWDDDGQSYMSVAAGIWISKVDLLTGKATDTFRAWNGTGERNPEGPHIYHKGAYHYLLIGEGGTELNHSVSIARATDLTGPYTGFEQNPILTARNTSAYFQTVGHADIFQDAAGNWWGIALATRSGPQWEVYPMGRETVLFPVKWENDWPVMEPVRGEMSGPLPLTDKNIAGNGVFLNEPDVVNFAPGSSLPNHFFFWRPPISDMFAISTPGHPNTLRINPSSVNLTATPGYDPAKQGLGFIARKQTSTYFEYSVDLSFSPDVVDEEAGVTIFLTQLQHVDLGVVNMPNSTSGGREISRKIRLRTETSGKRGFIKPRDVLVDMPKSWHGKKLRFIISTISDTTYELAVALACDPERSYMGIGFANATLFSGGSGPFSGKTTDNSYAGV